MGGRSKTIGEKHDDARVDPLENVQFEGRSQVRTATPTDSRQAAAVRVDRVDRRIAFDHSHGVNLSHPMKFAAELRELRLGDGGARVEDRHDSGLTGAVQASRNNADKIREPPWRGREIRPRLDGFTNVSPQQASPVELPAPVRLTERAPEEPRRFAPTDQAELLLHRRR
jgi:hypothetical protein